MPKIRPIQKSNHRVLVVKLLFLLILLGFGFFVSTSVKPSKIAKNRQKPITNLPKNLTMPQIGEIAGIIDDLNSESLKKAADETTNFIVGEAGDIIAKSASEAGAVAGVYIFEQAIKPIVNQINNLSPEQREILKKQLCQ